MEALTSHKGRHLLTRRAFLGVAFCSSGLAGSLLAHEHAGEQSYRRLSRERDGDPASRWTPLKPSASELEAWITVSGTPIDYPVALPDHDTPEDFYLDHDIDGTPRAAGCPYLDSRCSAHGTHLLIYGHRIAGSDTMFGSLWNRYTPAAFKELGDAVWDTSVDGKLSFAPLCALRVPGTYAPIQRFAFEDADALCVWLEDVAGSATATAPDSRERIKAATRVLTLVTCAEGNGHSATRTLVLFTREADEQALQ